MCRDALRRYQKKCHIFTGEIGPVNQDGRLVIKKVQLLRDDGVTWGYCDHICVSKKPFKDFSKGQEVRFTGKIFKYQRADSTSDYSVKVNKVRDKNRRPPEVSFLLYN